LVSWLSISSRIQISADEATSVISRFYRSLSEECSKPKSAIKIRGGLAIF
jgi:hypothetical protein